MEQFSIDTHPLIWYASGSTKNIGKKAIEILKRCEDSNATVRLIVPTLVVLEIFHFTLKRPDAKFADFLNALSSMNVSVVPFDEHVLKACYRLPRKLDIHDRVIAATAIVYDCPLVTKDETLKNLTLPKVVW